MFGVSHHDGHGGRGTTAVLCLCAITHSYLLFSAFPYVGYYVLDLLEHSGGSNGSPFILRAFHLNISNIGIFATLLGSVFTIGRFLAFGPWKYVRSHYGERRALILSLVLSAIFSIVFGMSRSYIMALTSRFMLGLSNGISGAIKRAAIDRAREKAAEKESSNDGKPRRLSTIEQEEALTISRVLTVMSFGSALAPAISGWLCSGSSTSGGSRTSTVYPYLLPNVFGGILCVLSAMFVMLIVENDCEGNNNNRPKSNAVTAGENTPLIQTAENIDPSSQPPSVYSMIWRNRSARTHFVAYAALSFCVACIDEAVPLFFVSQVGGPGMTITSVGALLGVAGIVTATIQNMSVGNIFMELIGLYSTLRLSSVLASVPCVFFPLCLILNAVAQSVRIGEMNAPAFTFAVFLVGILRLFAMIYFSLIGIALGRSMPISLRDDAARILTLIALIARAVGPIFGGVVLTLLSGYPWAIWSIIGLGVGLCATNLSFALCEVVAGKATAGFSKRRSTYLEMRQRQDVYTQLWDVRDDMKTDTSSREKWHKLTRKALAVNRFTGGALAAAPVAMNNKKDKRISWFDRTLRPQIDVDEVPFFIIGTNKDDPNCSPHVLTPPLMEVLHKHLPSAVCDNNFWLKYSAIRDGSSLTAFESKAEYSNYTILAIETLAGDVLGCFMSIPWIRSGRYQRDGQSFVFKLKKPRPVGSSLSPDELAAIEGDVAVYKWTGANEMCQLVASDKIAVGGGLPSGAGGDGFGFVISNSFSSGSSSPCKTYDNPCLVSDPEGGAFEVANIELWALTPFLFEADAERSERSQHKVASNLLQKNVIYGNSPSSQSPWSQFL